VGEKVAKPDEGAFGSPDNVAKEDPRNFTPELRANPFARHPSSAFGTFSPRKARGEKALD
jgi:hypothetical protein